MRITRRVFGTAAIGSMVLALVACGGGSSPAAESPDGVDLRMTVWTSNKDQLALFNSIADAYRAEHPGVRRITFDSLPFADYNSTLTTQIAGGNTPDLAWMGDISHDLIAAKALVPLTGKLKGTAGWDYGDLVDSVTAEFSRDGELYAYPFSNSPFALYVNNDLLAKAGQTAGKGELSWEQVSKIGGAVHAKTGKAGFVIRDFDYSGWNMLGTVWPGWGASAWNADGTQCGMNSDQMVSAFQFLHNAIYVDKSMPGPGVKADFFAGDSAFTIAQVSRATLLDGAFKYSIHPLPTGPSGKYSVIGQAGVGVLKSSKHVPQATEFLAYLTNPANAAKLAQYFPPPRKSLLTGAKLAAVNKKLSAAQLQAVVIDQLNGAVTLPNHTKPAEISQKGKAALDAIWAEDADIKSVLGKTCDALQPLLK
ncbi:sugar ABC transporter substrate-binding protein [Kribbella ginsengisoli]|uniref:ABC transporter substrate-binding protein n=1 Tax=Kribbella ginsengisoli TaxID=363865 RepID=UPI0031CF5346